MNQLNNRLEKLEKGNGPADPVDAITVTFIAPSETGPIRTGAKTRFLGVKLPELHQGKHQTAYEYDEKVDAIRARNLYLASRRVSA